MSLLRGEESGVVLGDRKRAARLPEEAFIGTPDGIKNQRASVKRENAGACRGEMEVVESRGMNTRRSAWVVLRVLSLALLSALVSSCGKQTPRYAEGALILENQVHAELTSATNEPCKLAQEFEGAFPSTQRQVGFTYDAEQKRFRGGATITTALYGRYLVKYFCEFIAVTNGVGSMMVDYRKPRFEIQSLARAITNSSGGVQYIFEQADQRWLNVTQWRDFRDKQFDLRTLNIIPKTNEPLIGATVTLP